MASIEPFAVKRAVKMNIATRRDRDSTDLLEMDGRMGVDHTDGIDSPGWSPLKPKRCSLGKPVQQGGGRHVFSGFNPSP